jgi:type III secretion protein V
MLRSGGARSQEDGADAVARTSQRESQFYGAMDGAMKFVKGDAIAGIVITVVNLVGGLAVGVMPCTTWSAGESSMRTYGLLTIGDGLVSQIPALLYVHGGRPRGDPCGRRRRGIGSLGRRRLSRQIFGNARAMGIAAIFLLALAIIPGLPALPFLVLAVVFFATSRTLILRERASNDATAKSHDTGAERDAQKPRMPLVVPFEIALGSALTSLRPQSERSTELSESLAALRETLFQDLGINLPTLRIELDESLPEHAYRISIHEVPVATYTLGADQNPSTHIRAESERWLRRRAHELIGLQETQTMLDQLDRAFPALVRNVVPKPVSLPQLSDILRRLLEEGVSVRPLREILEALAVYAPIERDPVALTELVRGSLRRAITHRHADGHTLNVYLVDPAIEDAVREAIQRTSTGTFLALAPDIARDITGAIKKTFTATDAPGAVLLTQPDVRRFFRRLIEADFPDRAVLSYPELAPEITVQPVDRITI